MPAYDLICEACGHMCEVVHGFDDPHPVKCPACGKMKLKQAWKKSPVYHNLYSPMHPRKNRGRGH